MTEFSEEKMNEQCRSDVSHKIDGIQRLTESMGTIEANLKLTQELSSCSVLNPILRRITHGAFCNEAVDGMAWMFGTSLLITLVCLIMLSTRAGLYNATIRKARRSRKDATEREWVEYKRFMSQYYTDSHNWKMEPSPTKKDQLSIEGIPSCETGVTEATSTTGEEFSEDDLDESFDSDCDATDAGQFLSPCREPQTFVEQVKTAEKIRRTVDVLDSELLPLTPPLTAAANFDISGIECNLVEDQCEIKVETQSATSSRCDEIMALTPSSASLDSNDEADEISRRQNVENPVKSLFPRAPQKLQKHLKRTSQRKILW